MPPDTSAYFYNYKGTYSVVLMALVNASYEFMMVDIGCNGCVSDGGVFKNTQFSKQLEEKKLNIPKPTILIGSNEPLPYVFVCDDAFALSENIMKPYPQANLTLEKEIFNYRLSRARQTVECAFGIMTARFQVLLGRINLDPNKATLIATTCCYLHNFLTKKNDRAYLHVRENDAIQIRLDGLQPTFNRNNSAKIVRNNFCSYFNNAGRVPWQEDRVREGRS